MDKMDLLHTARASNVVRVTLPVDTYFDLKKFQSVQATVLGRLGCGGCTSGWDIRFDFERVFVADAKLNVTTGPIAVTGVGG